jgi:hypothetical protein
MKALKRLARYVVSQKVKPETLVSYCLPIVTSFLRDEQLMKNSGLVECAVEALGAVCHCLPWSRYLIVLKHYLQQLPKSLKHQKIMVKYVQVHHMRPINKPSCHLV